MEHFFTYPADTPASELKNDRSNRQYIEDTLSQEAAEPAAEEAAESDQAPVAVPNQGAY